MPVGAQDSRFGLRPLWRITRLPVRGGDGGGFFTFPKEMGVILGIAVLLDAFVVRLLLVPVLLRIAGPVAWYLPTFVQLASPALVDQTVGR